MFVSKVMSLLFNRLPRFFMAFLPRSKHLLISWLQSPSAVILEPKKINLSLTPLPPPLFAINHLIILIKNITHIHTASHVSLHRNPVSWFSIYVFIFSPVHSYWSVSSSCSPALLAWVLPALCLSHICRAFVMLHGLIPNLYHSFHSFVCTFYL